MRQRSTLHCSHISHPGNEEKETESLTVNLSTLTDLDYNLGSVIAFPQHWQDGKSYEMPRDGRPDNGLMYITDCENTMITDKGRIRAVSGQIVYLPKGARYEAHFSTPNKACADKTVTDYLLNFLAYTVDGEPLLFADEITVITPRDGGRLRMMLEDAARKSENAACPPSLMKAIAFEIITEVSRSVSLGGGRGGAGTAISAALDYVGKNCLQRDVSVAELSEMCHVSTATLRRMFVASVGMSPKEYVNSLRLKRAVILLESGGVSVAEVSRLVGFEDPSYFSRFFKKHTGKNPTDFM